jgi:hypothetical protein
VPAAFTVIARNYVAQARVLARSFCELHEPSDHVSVEGAEMSGAAEPRERVRLRLRAHNPSYLKGRSFRPVAATRRSRKLQSMSRP